MELSVKNILREVKSYTIITIGMAAYAFAWIGIISPAKIMGGGMTGLALLVYYATGGEEGNGIPISYSYFVLNSIVLGTGVLMLGWIFGIKTIYSMVVVTVCLSLGEEFLPENVLGIANDKLLSAILGGFICGFGISRAILQGGSSGGTDIIAMIVAKYKSISLGFTIMLCDVFIVGASYFIYHDITVIIYGYITVLALGYSADIAIQGVKRTSQIMITTKKFDEISDAITATGRGVTLLTAQGWYTKNEQKIVMVYCRLSEVTDIQYLAKDIDEDAFIAVSSVNAVIGNGFEKLTKKIKKNEPKRK